MFDQEKDIDGFAHIPVVFSVNGTRLIPEGGETLITHNQEKPWYPYIGFDRQNSALARVKKKNIILSTFSSELSLFPELTKKVMPLTCQ